MQIAIIAPEITPFAKTGGLADVVGALGPALERLGHEVTLIMPAYKQVMAGRFDLIETDMIINAPVSDRSVAARVIQAQLGNQVKVNFIRADPYFDRDGLYGTSAGDYTDNAERFVFFSRAALEILRRDPPDIVHAHDWHAALAIVFLKADAVRYPELAQCKTVFTIHNLGFQGIFWEPDWHLLHIDRGYFTPTFLEFFGNINFLKGALVFADKITTVSPNYAKEIMEPEQGFGLDGVLRDRARDVLGILNGIDYDIWNPKTDPLISHGYEATALTEKRKCKRALQRLFGLPENSALPLFGIVSRLTSQKGLDLVEQILPQMLQQDLQLVLLGSGEARYVELFEQAAAAHPDKVGVRIGFDEGLAHQIEAGADFFLMPSLYEPCGLNQMYSLRYGTIPIVRAVGGLKDTVTDIGRDQLTGTGFVFTAYDPDELMNTIQRALVVYKDKVSWTTLRRQAMSVDNSWQRSAQAYANLFQSLVAGNLEV